MPPKPPLSTHYPWTTPSHPLLTSAPMRLASTAPLACAVTLAGGLGFLGAGTDVSTLASLLSSCAAILSSPSAAFANNYTYPARPHTHAPKPVLPVGVGFLLWGITGDALRESVVPAIAQYRPAAVLLYAPVGNGWDGATRAQLGLWARAIRDATGGATRLWMQIGSVAEAVCALETIPDLDVLVVQGWDAGGHGLTRGAGLISLLPEVVDLLARRGGGERPYVVAAGGIALGRQAAAVVVLGAEGVCLGTRFLASEEVNIARGYRAEVVRAQDGGLSTVRSSVYDVLRGTPGWPERYGGRGVTNESYEDWVGGQVAREENQRLYKEAEGRMHEQDGEGVWGPKGRLTTYAGTGIGLVKKVMPAGDIVREVQKECAETLNRASKL